MMMKRRIAIIAFKPKMETSPAPSECQKEEGCNQSKRRREPISSISRINTPPLRKQTPSWSSQKICVAAKYGLIMASTIDLGSHWSPFFR